MRILYIHPKGELAGGDFSLLTIIKNVDKKKYTPYVIVPKMGPLFSEYEKYSKTTKKIDFTVIKSPDNFFEFIKIITGFFPSIFKIWFIIKKWNIDLVHVNSIVVPSALIAAKLAGKPVIVHKREIIVARKIFGRILDLIATVFADKMIAISNETKNFSIKSLQNKAVVIYNGVDLSEISSKKGLSNLNYLHKLQPKIKLIGMFSRIEPWKGQEVAINAMGKVVKKFKNVRLLIFGKPYTAKGETYLEKIKELVKTKKLEEFIEFPGVVNSLNKVYSEFDIILLPSIDPEPFSRVVIESMAAKRPVIATNTGGNKESVISGKTGILVQSNNVEELGKAILYLIENDALREQMGERARKMAENYFDMKKNIKKIESLYNELTKS